MYVFEPQKEMYKLLLKNIHDNNLGDKIIPQNKGVFCFDGFGKMSSIDIDGGMGLVESRLHEESHLPCNFGGISIGDDGETVEFTTIDYGMNNINDIGFIHCDAQGAENFFSQQQQT